MNLAEQIIEAFGGLRPMAKKLNERHASLIQSWGETGRIPHYRKAQIEAAARAHKIELPPKAMEKLFPSKEEEAA